MNIELLTNLVRLANNNPNDNEANAAARKVCKMIASNGITNFTVESGKIYKTNYNIDFYTGESKK